MKNWKTALIPSSADVVDAMKAIEANLAKIALVVDENQKLLGTITDGDIRRFVMSGKSLTSGAQELMNKTPHCISESTTDEEIASLNKKYLFKQFPIVDENHAVIGLRLVEDFQVKLKRDNWAVLMAGGLGKRLRPLTEFCPKPLLPVGDRPIIDTIIRGLVDHGIHNILISVNYKSEMIESFCGKGERWGINIEYIHEKKSLGTAGALSMVPTHARQNPLLVMNGDLLTKINYSRLLAFHEEKDSPATMCIRKIEEHIPYGIVNFEENHLTSIEEKPQNEFWINAGIYVLSPEVLDYVPTNEYFDMNNMFTSIQEKQSIKPKVFPVVEYWSDVGLMSDYKKAQVEFDDNFPEKLPQVQLP